MMNKADNEAGNVAIDSLINYETVKVRAFNKLHNVSSKIRSYLNSLLKHGFLKIIEAN